MGKSKYQEKCLIILENDNFKTFDHDSTKKTGKNATNFTENEKQIIPTRILALTSSMEQLKCTKYLKMTQSMNFQYGQLFQTWELRYTICQKT